MIRSSCAVPPSIRQYSAKSSEQISSQLLGKLTVPAELAEVLKDIEHTRHLREDEHARALRLHGLEKFVEDYHLPSVFHEMLVGSIWWARFLVVLLDQRKRGMRRETYCTIEQIRMTSYFPKLNHTVNSHLNSRVKYPTCMTMFINRVFPSFLPVSPEAQLDVSSYPRASAYH